MTTKFQFSNEEDEILVECVANYASLYDGANKNYKNQQVRENIWKEIAEAVKRSSNDCKKRWRNIRDTYLRIKRGNKFPTGSASQVKSKWPLLAHLSFLDTVSYERNTQSNMPDSLKGSSVITTDTANSVIDAGSSEIIEEAPLMAIDDPSYRTAQNVRDSNADTYTKKRKSDTAAVTSKKRNAGSAKILKLLEKRSRERENLVQQISRPRSDESDPVLMFFKSMAMTVKTFPPEFIAEAKSRIFAVVNELELRSLQMNQTLTSPLGTSASETSLTVGSYFTTYSPSSEPDLTQL